MPFRLQRRCSLGLACLLLPVAASAQDAPHVRAIAGLEQLVETAALRSPTVEALIDELGAFDVTVYVRLRPLYGADLDGRLGLLTTTDRGHRYLLIELAYGRSEATLVATLGHELFHAVEIARDPRVTGWRALAEFYRRRGTETSSSPGRMTFETAGAEEAGRRVRRELLASATRSTWNSK